MTFEKMTAYLENAGYNVDGLTAQEVDALAYVEGFKINAKGRYHYAI